MSRTNSVRLIGNFGNKPKFVGSNQENSVLSFSFATHMTFKDSMNETVKKTEWHNIVAFGKLAGRIHQYMDKGSQAIIEGRLQTRQYLNKEGHNAYVTEIVCEDILFLGSNDKDGK